jgi:hypothetical protein
MLTKEEMVSEAVASLTGVVGNFTTYLRDNTAGELTMEQLLSGTSQDAHDLGVLITITLVLTNVIDDLEGV